MDKEKLILALAGRTNQSREAAERALNAVLNIIIETLASGESVKIVGFGSFDMERRASRTARDIDAGKQMILPASYVPVFHPGKRLRDLITPIEEGGDFTC
jgi:nucleoid DNA-binding protein